MASLLAQHGRRTGSTVHGERSRGQAATPENQRPAPPHSLGEVQVLPQIAGLQPKLTIGAPDDPLEREAHRVADRVMRMPEPEVQRARACGGKCANCSKDKDHPVRAKSHGVTGNSLSAAPPVVRDVLASSGRPLGASTRAFMEPRFGHDFRNVRIHVGPRAERATRSLGARAFTLGNRIVFGSQEFAPESTSGRQLLAHELAHTTQQLPTATLRAQREDGTRSSFGPVELPSAGAAAAREVEVWISAFIPRDIDGLTKRVPGGPHAGKTMIEGPFAVSDCFLTDQRNFSSVFGSSSRMRQKVAVSAASSSIKKKGDIKICDPTHEVDCEDGDEECTASGSTSNMRSDLQALAPHRFRVALESAANNPCFTGSPSIDYRGEVIIDLGAVPMRADFSVLVDSFPAFEMYVAVDGGSPATLFRHPPPPGSSPADLFGGPTTRIRGFRNL